MKGEWGRKNSSKFDRNVLEEGQDVVAIVCNGGKRLGGSSFGGGLLRLTWLCFGFCGFICYNAILFVGLVCFA